MAPLKQLAAGLFFGSVWADVTITSAVFVTSTICPCFSSSALFISSISTSRPQSPIAATPTDANPGSPTTGQTITAPFRIYVETINDAPTQQRVFYLGFLQGDVAAVVPDMNSASLFRINNGYLLDDSDSQYVGVNKSAGYQVLQKYRSISRISGGWSLDEGNKHIALNGRTFAFGGSNAAFCSLQNNTLVAGLDIIPPGCTTANLLAGPIPDLPSSGISSTLTAGGPTSTVLTNVGTPSTIANMPSGSTSSLSGLLAPSSVSAPSSGSITLSTLGDQSTSAGVATNNVTHDLQSSSGQSPNFVSTGGQFATSSPSTLPTMTTTPSYTTQQDGDSSNTDVLNFSTTAADSGNTPSSLSSGLSTSEPSAFSTTSTTSATGAGSAISSEAANSDNTEPAVSSTTIKPGDPVLLSSSTSFGAQSPPNSLSTTTGSVTSGDGGSLATTTSQASPPDSNSNDGGGTSTSGIAATAISTQPTGAVGTTTLTTATSASSLTATTSSASLSESTTQTLTTLSTTSQLLGTGSTATTSSSFSPSGNQASSSASSSSVSISAATPSTTAPTTTGAMTTTAGVTTTTAITTSPAAVTTSPAVATTSSAAATTSSAAPPPPPLTCPTNGFLVSLVNGISQLFNVDLTTGIRSLITAQLGDGTSINALGYNALDNYLYGVLASTPTPQVIQVGPNGQILTLRTLPVQPGAYNVGDVDENGYLWIAYSGTYWVQVNLIQVYPILASGSSPLPNNYNIYDWAYVPGGGNYLYAVAVDANGFAYLHRFDRTAHTWTQVGTGYGLLSGAGGIYGAVYATQDGFLYGSDNLTGRLYRFSLDGRTSVLVGVGPTASSNDGAHCINSGAGAN